jgi:hypothetical protein
MKSDKPTQETNIDSKTTTSDQPSATAAVPDQYATTAIWQQNIRTLVALNVVSVSVAVLLFVGLIFSWATLADLNQVREEIDGLKQFEKRIAANVDLMNAGIQNRLAKIDRRISAIQSGVRLIGTGNRGRNETIEQLTTVAGERANFFGSTTADLMLTPALTSQEASVFEPRHSEVQVSTSQSPNQHQGSTLFRRVVAADGKVHYEKR